MSAKLNIVADENIPNVAALFSSLGEVTTVNGRQLSAAQIAQADVLLVRSVTRVDENLLAGSAVKFVGTATIGIDHLDTEYLDRNGIHWTSAPGSNANSVADYVISALCRLDGVIPSLFSGAVVGIIGMGNVGSRVYHRLSQLGVRCCAYDPLLEQDKYSVLTDLDTVLAADVVCLHTPLTTSGDFPTYHLLDEKRLGQLKPATVLLNAGRGAVIDNQALKQLLSRRDDLCVVLDVWEHEPTIDIELMKLVDIATPHIAGYSLDGKLAGAEMLYQACCDFFEQVESPSLSNTEKRLLPLTEKQQLHRGIKEAVLACYDVAEDDQRLRGGLLHCDEAERGAVFDRLRKQYPVRREMGQCQLSGALVVDLTLEQALISLGFELIE